LLQSGTYKIGASFHSGRFADQRFDTAGQSLESPLSSGVARMLNNNYSLYAALDQPLWQESEGAGGS